MGDGSGFAVSPGVPSSVQLCSQGPAGADGVWGQGDPTAPTPLTTPCEGDRDVRAESRHANGGWPGDAPRAGDS